jgi:hypothetical protein
MSDNSETKMKEYYDIVQLQNMGELLEEIKIRDQNMEQLLQKFRYQNTKRIICNNEFIKKNTITDYNINIIIDIIKSHDDDIKRLLNNIETNCTNRINSNNSINRIINNHKIR